MLAVLGTDSLMMERDGKSKNILYRPKRLKKFMQTTMKTKRKLQKIQSLTLLYIIFDEKGPLSHTFYQLVTNVASSTYNCLYCL